MDRRTVLDPAAVALRKLEAQQVSCPRCRAGIGTPCRSSDGKELAYHPERYQRFRTGW